MKQPAKPAEQPKALAILVRIVDLAITFRFPEKNAIVVRCRALGRRIVTCCTFVILTSASASKMPA